jgi:hypothetical protein
VRALGGWTGGLCSVGQGPGESEAGQDAVVEAGHGADPARGARGGVRVQLCVCTAAGWDLGRSWTGAADVPPATDDGLAGSQTAM